MSKTEDNNRMYCILHTQIEELGLILILGIFTTLNSAVDREAYCIRSIEDLTIHHLISSHLKSMLKDIV